LRPSGRAGLLLQAVVVELRHVFRDLLVGEQERRADLERQRILLAERLELDREPHGLAQIAPGRDHAVIGHQRAAAPLERRDHERGKLGRAIGRVGRAADIGAARDRDHVVHGRDLHAADREGRRMDGMRVHDSIHVAACGKNVAVHAPFRGGRELVLGAPVHAQMDDVVRLQLVIGATRRRDEKTVLPAQRKIAGGPLVEAGRIHGAARIDQRLPRPAFLLHGHRPIHPPSVRGKKSRRRRQASSFQLRPSRSTRAIAAAGPHVPAI